MKHAACALTLLALAATARAEPIKSIEVFENTKTRTDTVILIADVDKGDDVGVSDIAAIEARLVDSGLFKDVEVFTQPVSGGLKLIIIARDKHSWVIAPTVYNQPTNKGAGIGFGENNLFGENKKLLLYGQVATGDSFFIAAYVDPSIAGTRWKWQYDLFLRRERVIEYEGPQELVGEIDEIRQSKLNYLNTGLRFGLELFRGASLEARGRGAYVSYDDVELSPGATLADVSDDPTITEVPKPGAEGWDFSYEVIASLDRRANWYGISHGDQYVVSYERTVPRISDFHYWYSTFRFLRARKYFERHNLIVKGMVGYGDNLPFQQEYTSGGTDLRGYKNRQLRGDFKAAGNVEYSVPLFTIAGVALRALAFYDVSYTAFLDPGDPSARRNYLPSHGELGMAPLKNSVGLGTRVYMRQIVLPLLGLDVGYGLERGAPRSTSLSVLLISSALAVACGGGSRAPDHQAPATAPARPAELVLRGGDVITMDPDRPRASAIAIAGGRILAVGDDAAVRAHIGPDTRVIELAGRSVSPGLVDGHAHLYGLGGALENVSLRGMDSAEAVAAAVAAAAAGRPAGEWITGRGWDQNRWTPKAFPHHRVLDAAIADHPVAVRRVDGHALWANAAAMRLAGITAGTRAPAGGQILRDPDGNPTGVFVDTAMDLIERHIPAPDAQVRRRRILAGARHAVERGLTGVHEMGIDDETAAVYAELAAAGELPLRVYAFLSGDPETVASLPGRTLLADDGDDYFALRAVKMYADGALGSRGAALLEPYADQPDHRGNWVTPAAELARAARVAAEHGWQLGVHAIGDAANRAVLDAYEAVIREHPDADLRFRIEHAQVVAPADLPRFAELGVLAAMQPTHATSDMPWAEDRVGPERIRGAYAWRSILDSGGVIVGGSDFPVEEVSPLLGLYAAVTRQDATGQPPGGWYPDQRMTLEEAIAAFTVAPARAAFVEDHRGRLRPGYVADLTVYDRPLAGDASLLDTRIDLTLVGGRPVYQRQD